MRIALCALVALSMPLTCLAQENLSQSQGSSPETSENPEILVLARKARTVRIRFRIDDKTRHYTCRVARSSGDREFDAAMCEPVRRCANVEPLTAASVDTCLRSTRRQVLEEYLAAHPRS